MDEKKNLVYRQGDLVFDIESGDGGPYSEKSQKAGTSFTVTKNGDFVVRTGGVERGRIAANGTGSGIFLGVSSLDALTGALSLVAGKNVTVTDNSPSAGNITIATTLPKVTISSWSGGPPASPSDTDIWVATAVDGNGTRWQFQYNAGSTSASKWEFIGGPPVILSNGTGTHPTAANVFQETDTTLRFTCVRGGDYQITQQMQGQSLSGNALLQVGVWDVTGATQLSGSVAENTAASGNMIFMNNTLPITGVAAGRVLSQGQQTNDGTPANTTYFNKKMLYLPIRIA